MLLVSPFLNIEDPSRVVADDWYDRICRYDAHQDERDEAYNACQGFLIL